MSKFFVWSYAFISLGYIPRSRIAESHGNSMLTFETILLNFNPQNFVRKAVTSPFYRGDMEIKPG